MAETAFADGTALGARVPGVASAPIALLALDDDGRVREVSPAACELIGLGREDILGHRLGELLPRRHPVAPSKAQAGGPASGANRHGPKRWPTVREREILSLLASGDTDAAIAERLELSPATVQTHVRNAKQKMGAKTRAQAVAMALRGGLISAS